MFYSYELLWPKGISRVYWDTANEAGCRHLLRRLFGD